MKSKFEQLPHFFTANVQEKADSTITGIGKAIFTQYLIAFEIAGLLLLTAFIYAASLTRMEKQD
jgi:NADH:ubiquinone oxidoreductase subunit 6 (subunit J)